MTVLVHPNIVRVPTGPGALNPEPVGVGQTNVAVTTISFRAEWPAFLFARRPDVSLLQRLADRTTREDGLDREALLTVDVDSDAAGD